MAWQYHDRLRDFEIHHDAVITVTGSSFIVDTVITVSGWRFIVDTVITVTGSSYIVDTVITVTGLRFIVDTVIVMTGLRFKVMWCRMINILQPGRSLGVAEFLRPGRI